MKIRVKVMGVLKERTPSDGRLTLSDQATIRDALSVLQISPANVQVFTVNGNLVRDPAHRLSEGDELLVLPPVGGG